MNSERDNMDNDVVGGCSDPLDQAQQESVEESPSERNQIDTIFST